MTVRIVKMLRRMVLCIGAAVLPAFLTPPANAVVYNFTSFDGPGNNGGGTTVNGINNAGDVVGFSSDNASAPTLFTNFIRNPDGTFSVLSIGGDPLAMANGVNNSRDVVGGTSNGCGIPAVRRLADDPSRRQRDDGLPNGVRNQQWREIVGQYTDNSTGTTPGYLFSGGAYTVLTPVANADVTNAQGVNNDGIVTGFYSVDGVHQHGFFYNSATQAFSLPPDPNIPNLVLTQFLGLNDDGVAVGYYQTPDGSQHGFLFDVATDAYTFLDDPFAATTGVSITQITGVNDSGEITGFYVDAATGLQRGFIATLAIPEPSTWAMMTLGFAGLAAWRRDRAGHKSATLAGLDKGS